jgi:hypothetical protein
VLAEFYEQLKEEDEDALEIVFASADNDQESFDGYYGKKFMITSIFKTVGIFKTNDFFLMCEELLFSIYDRSDLPCKNRG